MHFTMAAQAMKLYQTNNIVDDEMILSINTGAFRPIQDDEDLKQLKERPICEKKKNYTLA